MSPSDQERDLWWGSYSTWSLVPSFLLCLVLTGLIAWAGWTYAPRGWARVWILSGSGFVWFIQFARWAMLSLGNNYRLTTHRLLVERGIAFRRIKDVPLESIVDVQVLRNGWDQILGVGRIEVRATGFVKPVVMRGLRDPERWAESLRLALAG